MMKNKLGIYIHIPFCEKKCNYCDFNSSLKDNTTINSYVYSLIKEISIESEKYREYLVDTIFIGGGTPSVLEEKNILKIVQVIKYSFSIDDKCEFTIEQNPNSSTPNKLKVYKEIGINRLSFGVQSFNEKELGALGRIHTLEDIYNSIENAKKLNFSNININLMEGIPYQNLESFKNSIKKAVDLDLSHLSVYSLILEEGTYLYRENQKGNNIYLPSEEEERQMYYWLKNFLNENGYNQYEISNFSKKGYECKHNLKYWSFGDYVGFGISSHSKVGNNRFSNTNNLRDYIYKLENNIDLEREIINLSIKDITNEYIFMGLRKTSGFNYKMLEKISKIKFFEEFSEEINKNLEKGYIKIIEDQISLTNKGLDYANLVELDFYRL